MMAKATWGVGGQGIYLGIRVYCSMFSNIDQIPQPLLGFHTLYILYYLCILFMDLLKFFPNHFEVGSPEMDTGVASTVLNK